MPKFVCSECGFEEDRPNEQPVLGGNECPKCSCPMTVAATSMTSYKVTGETPDGNRFELPIEASDEDSAIDRATEELPDDYTVDSVA